MSIATHPSLLTTLQLTVLFLQYPSLFFFITRLQSFLLKSKAFAFDLSPLTSPAVTLHDYLSSIRTFVVLCRRELYFKNLAVLNFLTVLPRCRSGCKDAIILIACQVLF